MTFSPERIRFRYYVNRLSSLMQLTVLSLVRQSHLRSTVARCKSPPIGDFIPQAFIKSNSQRKIAHLFFDFRLLLVTVSYKF